MGFCKEPIPAARKDSQPRGCRSTKAAKRSAKAACEARWLKCQPSIGSSPTACPRLPEDSGPDYFAFFFSASIRSLAAGPDEAGFWPVISWPSATV